MSDLFWLTDAQMARLKPYFPKPQITEQTSYRWRKQRAFVRHWSEDNGECGMGTDQLKELKRLQRENDRLRRALSDLTLDKLILSEAARGNY